MSIPVVVDTSVVLKWLKPLNEQRVPEALSLLQQHRDETIALCSPDHMLLEASNALWSHRVGAGRIERAVGFVRGLHLTLLPVAGELLDGAVVLACEFDITVYDAVFAALARQMNCELVTDDAELARSGACRVRRLG